MLKERRDLVYVAATLASAIAFTPALSNAKQRRDMSGYCNAENSQFVGGINAPQSRGTDGSSVGEGIANFATNRALLLVCPYRDEDFYLKQEVTNLNVHVFTHVAGGTAAAACAQFFNTGTIDCGALFSFGTTGDQTLTPELSAWGSGNALHFGYVFVQVNAATNNGLNRGRLRGIWTFSPNKYPWEP
jgi:hypothetical protein